MEDEPKEFKGQTIRNSIIAGITNISTEDFLKVVGNNVREETEYDETTNLELNRALSLAEKHDNYEFANWLRDTFGTDLIDASY